MKQQLSITVDWYCNIWYTGKLTAILYYIFWLYIL